MSDKIWFDPTSDKWVLSDGEHYLEVSHWVREIIVNEFERETRQLKADNAKLRELVVEVFKCAMRGADCETCKVTNDGYACLYIMHELGVEVDV